MERQLAAKILFEWAGGLLGLADLFEKASEYIVGYLKGAKESHDVKIQLRNALYSLESYRSSSKALDKSGKALKEGVERLPAPASVHNIMEVMRLMITFQDDLSGVLSAILLFGKECHVLTSPTFEPLMDRAKDRKPQVYAAINSFGRNYNPRNNTLDMSEIPMLIRVYGKKGGWNDNDALSKEVKEGSKLLTTLVEKAKIIRKQRFRIHDRQLIRAYLRSLQRVGKDSKCLTANRGAEQELRRNAPSWFLELDKVMVFIRKAVPELAKSDLPGRHERKRERGEKPIHPANYGKC